MTEFDRCTSLQRIDDAVFEGKVDERWQVVRGPHGGYLASIVLRAMLECLDDVERPPRSLTVHFLTPPEVGPIRISVGIERAGRQLTTLSARMHQHDRLAAIGLAAFSRPWDAPDFMDAEPPRVLGIDEGFRVPIDHPETPPFLANFDMRWGIGSPPFSGADRAELGGWFRLTEPRTLDHVLVPTYADAWAPAVFPRVSEPVVAPTIDLTVHFRTPVPLGGATPDDYYLGVFRSVMGRQGFFEEDGELWSADGTLIAQSRQLALMLPRR